MIVISPAILIHGCNIFFIITKVNIHKPRYYILLNLTISDLCMVGVGLTSLRYNNGYNEYTHICSKIFYALSLITTVLISVDRDIAVRYCLRYNQIVTNRNLAISIIVSWLVSIVINIFPAIEELKLRNGRQYYRYSEDAVSYVTRFGCVLILMALSISMLMVRNKHISFIKSLNNNSSADTEKLNILRDLKQSLKDVFRLNVVTAVLVTAANIGSVIYIFDGRKTTKQVYSIIGAAYFLTNPFLYALTMSELRMHYQNGLKHIFSGVNICCFKHRSSQVAPSQAPSSEDTLRNTRNI